MKRQICSLGVPPHREGAGSSTDQELLGLVVKANTRGCGPSWQASTPVPSCLPAQGSSGHRARPTRSLGAPMCIPGSAGPGEAPGRTLGCPAKACRMWSPVRRLEVGKQGAW